MKLIDQYIYAINKKLPYDSRKEITLELKSILLDDIESKYGETPSNDEIKEVINTYGSPSKVANQYNPHKSVIGTGFTDLYFFIGKMIFLGLGIAFIMTYLIGFIESGFTLNYLTLGFAKLLMNLGSAMVPAIGFLTIIFIVLTRMYKEEIVDLDENWTPDDLKDIQVSPKVNSILESLLTIIFTTFGLVLLNSVPYFMSIGEKLFESSGIKLGHHINIQAFKFYLIFISITWIGQIIYHILVLLHGEKTKNISIFEIIITSFSFILLIIIISDSSLYNDYTSYFGIRAIFSFAAIISFIELAAMITKHIKYFVVTRSEF